MKKILTIGHKLTKEDSKKISGGVDAAAYYLIDDIDAGELNDQVCVAECSASYTRVCTASGPDQFCQAEDRKGCRNGNGSYNPC